MRKKMLNNNEEYLYSLIESTKKNWEQIIEENKKTNQSGQQILDIANFVKDIIPVIPPNEINAYIQDWEIAKNQSVLVSSSINYSTSGSSMSTAGTIVFATNNIVEKIKPFLATDFFYKPEISDSISAINLLADLETSANKVITLFNIFELNKAPKGKKSPENLFITAIQAYKTPISTDNPIITSLIPLRESIEHSIEFLLSKRPEQEKASSWSAKIISIGSNFKIESITTDAIEKWAKNFEEILNPLLSPAKEQNISRKEWLYRLQQGTLFLLSFLSGLDSKKVFYKK